MRTILFTCLLSAVFIAQVHCAPRFAGCFGDHAVLQQGEKIAVWGFSAQVKSKLTVRLGEVEAVAVVKGDGTWVAHFSELEPSKTGRSLQLFEDGKAVAQLEDILVGEVWLAAGQSNMQMQVRSMLKQMPAAKPWVDSADLQTIRFRRVGDRVLTDRNEESADIDSTSGKWLPMTPQNALGFSAAAAAFAREIAAELDCPVGIIDVSWGGKPIEPFIPREMYRSPLLKKIKQLADAEQLDELKKLRGGVIIRNPEGFPGAIFNARMAPLTNVRLAGFLWYQAESNAGKGEDPREYCEKMQALAEGWRKRWANESLPLYFVQLPSFPNAPGWIRVREEQRLASLSVANSAMAVTIDIRGEGIHPPDKLEVGRRLALCALKKTYEKVAVVSFGPVFDSIKVVNGSVEVSFSEINGGLVVGDRPEFAEVEFSEGSAVEWFEVAGKDKVWHPAKAVIAGDKVIVSSSAVTDPVAVRYACHTHPQGGNLYNRAGLPASPFCSELDWLGWPQ